MPTFEQKNLSKTHFFPCAKIRICYLNNRKRNKSMKTIKEIIEKNLTWVNSAKIINHGILNLGYANGFNEGCKNALKELSSIRDYSLGSVERHVGRCVKLYSFYANDGETIIEVIYEVDSSD
jgi:hypothetical protein